MTTPTPQQRAEQVIAKALNLVVPMRHIFGGTKQGREFADALEVLLAQEVEHAAAALSDAGLLPDGETREPVAAEDVEAVAEVLTGREYHVAYNAALRAEADRDRRIAAEALREAADEMAARLDTFAQNGRHTRARWAENWLRARADQIGGAPDA